MKFASGHVYHVYNQGNNHQKIFYTHADYARFLALSKDYLLPYADVLAWCLLPNHFHFMLVANEKAAQEHQQGGLLIDALTNGLRKLLSTYCQQFNQCNQRSGNLFRAKTKAKDLTAQQLAGAATTTDYYINCFYYIHQNPLRHQLVTDINQWKYSSYRFYARQRRNDFCNQQLAAEICAYAPDSFVNLVSQRLPPSTSGNLHAG